MAATRSTMGLILVLCTLAPQYAVAQEHRISAATHYYADDDSLTVVHPSVAAKLAVGEDTALSIGYDADIITSATIDVRTSASVRAFEETRHGGSLSVTHALSRTLSAGGGVALSVSPDFRSYTASLQLQHETNDRVHAFSVDARGAFSEVGRAHDPELSGTLIAVGLTGSWTAVVSHRLVMDVAAALDSNHGYLESPYRFVRIGSPDGQTASVPEEVPDRRLRGALSARLRFAAMDSLFLRFGYRLHGDDWGVLGHTGEVQAIVAITPDVRATLGGRFLVQGGASFYHGEYATYPSVPTFRTRDRELATGYGGRVMGSVRWRFIEAEHIDISAALRVELHQYHYVDTPTLSRRRALVTGLSFIGEL